MSEKIVRRDAVIVGAGFAGLYMTKRLIDDGLSVITIDMAEDIGGYLVLEPLSWRAV